MCAHDPGRILQDFCDVIDVQTAGVGANQAIRLGIFFDVQKHLAE